MFSTHVFHVFLSESMLVQWAAALDHSYSVAMGTMSRSRLSGLPCDVCKGLRPLSPLPNSPNSGGSSRAFRPVLVLPSYGGREIGNLGVERLTCM
jgi:hypothetical protein